MVCSRRRKVLFVGFYFGWRVEIFPERGGRKQKSRQNNRDRASSAGDECENASIKAYKAL